MLVGERSSRTLFGQYEGNREKERAERPNTKLGTFEGLFLPTALNVLSILMFLRFGFILGQMGIMGTFLLLVMSYTVDLLTVLSVCAISTNGTVRGGGAYYMISRSLGPEFGGAIGIIFYIGQILNASLNVVGFIEPLLVNFGNDGGEIASLLPIGYFWGILYSSILLAICTGISLVGSKLVSKTAFLLFVVLTMSTLSIPISTFFVSPFRPLEPPNDTLVYTGPNFHTFLENLWPHFTSNAVGSDQPPGVPETFRNIFGIFFPATAGIFAGASMSGELENPSKSIPRGTIDGLIVSFIFYSSVILSMGSSIPRELLHKDLKIIQSVNIHKMIIICGEFSTSLFSVIMGIVGAATMLTAIANDQILPGIAIFATDKKKATEKYKSEMYSVLFTWFLAQVFLFANINQIAIFITMAFLMTFIVTNLACFLLKIGSAPNFRPSFKYFSTRTAFAGVVTSVAAMYVVDGFSASMVIVFLVCLIMVIHYLTPPLHFGDISQLLIYHQVRKYLLRLKLQMSVKYWRPQILLLCDDPRSCLNLIKFCNHLKKGGLYILGHVVVFKQDKSDDKSEFDINSYREQKAQKEAWQKLCQVYQIKAFVQIGIGPSLPWGVRNVYLGSGLGGMRPNITILGFYDFVKHNVDLLNSQNAKNVELPTDSCRKERKIPLTEWVQIVEDLIIMQSTVGVAANFGEMQVPELNFKHHFWTKPISDDKDKKFVDLYPIQMTSISQFEDGKSILSTNFDTYTLILQLGFILSTVRQWKLNNYKLRVIVFVENEEEVEEERERLSQLLSSLRIDAQIKVICISDGSLDSYNFLVRGFSRSLSNKVEYDRINNNLERDQWWKNLCKARDFVRDVEKKKLKRQSYMNVNASLSSVFDYDKALNGIDPLFPNGMKSYGESPQRDPNFKLNRRYTLSNLHEQGLSMSLNMNTQQGMYFGQDDSLGESDTQSGTEGESESESENEDADETSDEILPNYSKKVYGAGNVSTPQENVKQLVNSPRMEGKSVVKNRFPTNVRSIQNENDKKKDVDQLSIRSSRSNLRPNFLSMKTPHAHINSGPTDADDENNPSISFVDPQTEGENKDLFFAKKNRSNVFREHESVDPLAVDVSKQAKRQICTSARPALSHTTSIISNDDNFIHRMGTSKVLDKRSDDVDKFKSGITRNNKTEKDITLREKEDPIHPTETDHDLREKNQVTYKSLKKEIGSISFNDLPAKGQHIILNELMRRNSPKDQTQIIMSTLPAPVINTHMDIDESYDYVLNLAIWFADLPPILLVNSQTVTVTTAL